MLYRVRVALPEVFHQYRQLLIAPAARLVIFKARRHNRNVTHARKESIRPILGVHIAYIAPSGSGLTKGRRHATSPPNHISSMHLREKRSHVPLAVAA